MIPDRATMFWKLELNSMRKEKYTICSSFFLVVIHLVDNQAMALFLESWYLKVVLKVAINCIQVLRIMVVLVIACCLKVDIQVGADPFIM